MENVISERDTVIDALQKNVLMTSQHVKQLQENLSHATEAVKENGSEQGEVFLWDNTLTKDWKFMLRRV